jgi:hypothetical protein
MKLQNVTDGNCNFRRISCKTLLGDAEKLWITTYKGRRIKEGVIPMGKEIQYKG